MNFNGEIVFDIADDNPVELTVIYDEVDITIYIRSEFAQIGYSLPSHILEKASSLGCSLHFDILSFGMAIDEEA